MEQHNDDPFNSLFKKSGLPDTPNMEFKSALEEKFLNRVQQKASERRKRRGPSLVKLAAAAVILLTVILMLEFTDRDVQHKKLHNPSSRGQLMADIIVDPQDYSLTIFNDDLVMVRDRRAVEKLPKGHVKLSYNDVAKKIIPESVSFVSVNQPGAFEIYQQNYNYDIANAQKLMNKYIDKTVSYKGDDDKFHEGRLMSISDGYTFESNGEIRLQQNGMPVRLPSLPDGLLTKPTLSFDLNNRFEDRHFTQMAYLSRGVSWNATHNTVIDEEVKKLSLQSWITVSNYSGTSFNRAKIKFMAGDVNQIRDLPNEMDSLAAGAPGADSVPLNKADVTEKSFADYHLYEMTRVSDLPDNSVKQLLFIDRQEIAYSDYYRIKAPYPSRRSESTHIASMHVIEIKNSDDNNLGVPLPKGQVNIMMQSDDVAEMVSRPHIDHTPQDETVELDLGRSFRILSRFVLKEYETSRNRMHVAYTYDVSFKNMHHKDETVYFEIPVYSDGTQISFEGLDDVEIETVSSSLRRVKLNMTSDQILNFKMAVEIQR